MITDRIKFKSSDPEVLKNMLEEALIWGNVLCEELNSENSKVEGFKSFKNRIIFKGQPVINSIESNSLEDSWQ